MKPRFRRSGSSRLSVALHALLHLAERDGEPMTSEAIAWCIGTNPVVVRRTLAGLREAGIVASARGNGGGWTLAREPEAVTLAAVQGALGEGSLLPPADAPETSCLIERTVDGLLGALYVQAETLLAQALGRFTLADLLADAAELAAARKGRRAA